MQEKLPGVVQTILPLSSHCIIATWSKRSLSVALLSMFKFASIILPSVLSVSWSLSESSFNVKFWAGVISSRTFHCLFGHNHFCCLCRQVRFSEYLWLHTSSLPHNCRVIYVFHNSMRVQFTFTSSRIALLFLDVLSPMLTKPSFNCPFLEKWTGFIAGRQGGHTTACFAACVWEERQMCSDQQSRTSFERSGILGCDWCTSITRVAFVHRKASNEV